MSMSMSLRVLVLGLGFAACVTACEGKVLDVGTANRSASQAGDPNAEPDAGPPAQPPAQPVANAALAPVTGVWAMYREDGMFGIEYEKGRFSPIELEVLPDGRVFRYECLRTSPATEPCVPSATLDCMSGSVVPETNRWRMSFAEIQLGNTPELGETLLTQEGDLVVRYIHPTFSAGYFHRVGDAGEQGGCPR
jgi:hypothetical protein